MLFVLYKHYYILLQDISDIVAREQAWKCHAVRQCGSHSRKLPGSGIAGCDHTMRDRFEGMTKTFRSWNTSTLVINALRSWTWIEGNATPGVATLNLPDSPVGQLVHKADVEQTALG
jgi:hypothetical protein